MHTPSLGLITRTWTRLTLLAALALGLEACDNARPGSDSDNPGFSSGLDSWAEIVRVEPDPTVVENEGWRDAMLATGLPWKVRDRRTGIELLLVPPGEYTRGDLSQVPDIQDDIPDHQAPHALPPHRVVIETPYYLGRTEVTIGQWSTFASETGYLTGAEDPDGEGGSTINSESDWVRDPAATWRDPSPGLRPAFPHEPSPTDPVAQISWDDATAFSDHYGFRLPTEAEWEHAARAGTTTRYWWGDELEEGGGGMFNVSDQSAAPFFRWPAYPFDDGHVLAAPTDRSTEANPWGFVDILGNLQEWVSNWYDPEFYSVAKANEPVSAHFDEQATGSVRSYRGGCWDSSPGQATVFVRGGYERHTDVIGFRVVRDAEEGAQATQQEATDTGSRVDHTLIGTPLRVPDWSPEVRARLEEDLAMAQAAMDVAPEREDAFIWLGRRLGYLARFPEAIEVFTRGLDAHPDSYKLLRFRGRHLARNRQFHLAIADYLRAAELMEDHSDTFEPNGLPNSIEQPRTTYKSNIFYYLAQTSFAVGDFETMLSGMEKALNEPLGQYPDRIVGPSFWQYLAHKKLGQDEEAQAVVDAVPDDLEVLEDLTYYEAVLFLKGTRTRDEVLPDADAIIKFAIAMDYHFRGEQEVAEEMWREIVVDSPQGFWPAEVELVRAGHREGENAAGPAG